MKLALFAAQEMGKGEVEILAIVCPLLIGVVALIAVLVTIYECVKLKYPQPKSQTYTLAECDDKENITGLCILEGRNCRTKSECAATMAKHRESLKQVIERKDS
jgi:hypothetical protein